MPADKLTSLERYIVRHRWWLREIAFRGWAEGRSGPYIRATLLDRVKIAWLLFKTRNRKKTELPEYAPPGELQEGKHIVGYLGIIGTEPITLNDNLVMWSCRRKAYVEMKDAR